MKRIKKLFGGQKKQQPRGRAAPLWFEQLEDRTLLTVSSTLSGGVLDVAFDANNDAAIISVAGSNIRVSSGAINRDFAASSVQGITAHSVAGSGQSLTLNNNVTLSNNLLVQGLANVSAANATYRAATISVTGGESISVQRSTLTATGDLTLSASKTISAAQSGALGATASANAAVTIVDTTLSGQNINLLATSTLTANSGADSSNDTSSKDFARVTSGTTAQVSVAGTSRVNAGGNVLIRSVVTDTTSALAQSRSTSNNASSDAALALASVTDTATAVLSDSAAVTAGGSFTLLARNQTNVSATADGAAGGAAAKGGSVARAVLDGTTRASVEGQATVNAGTIDISATSTDSISTLAKSASGGATQNDADTQQQLQSNNARTSDGGIAVAGALAITQLQTRQTEASVTSTGAIVSRGSLHIGTSSSTTSTATADGTATNPTSSGGSGVGVAVAINSANPTSQAFVGGAANLQATSITVDSLSPAAGNYAASATSGAGGASVGVAGALAINTVTDRKEALVKSGAAVNVNGADLTLSAQNLTNEQATAAPEGTGATGSDVGVGASVAVNTATNITRAEVEDTARIITPDDLTLSATSSHTASTSASIGATGGVAVTPGVALSVIDNETSARMGTGTALSLTGGLSETASETGSTTTTARGDSAGSSVAVGATLGLNDVTDRTTATTARSITTAGNVSLSASTSGATSATGTTCSSAGSVPTPSTAAQATTSSSAARATSESCLRRSMSSWPNGARRGPSSRG